MRKLKLTPGRARASRVKAWAICAASVDWLLRNFFLAGVLKNKSRTSTRVPTGQPASSTLRMEPALTSTRQPASRSAGRERRVMRLTAEMLGMASPRKPRVPTCKRSSPVDTLLVAWRSRHMSRSSRSMPQPSSTTRISERPAASTCTAILAAPASNAFSNSSFNTLAGRSTTSPAAIWLATSSDKRRTRALGGESLIPKGIS